MIELLRENFPRPNHYLVKQKDTEEINRFMGKYLLQPFQKGRKHNLWGRAAKDLPGIGRKIGWVTNTMVATFLNETVELEIADACAAKNNLIQPTSEHLFIARTLLQRFEMNHLAQQNPFHLSEGEAKLLWLFTQWVKSPEFLIIGYLPSNLSKQRITQVVEFLLNKKEGTEVSPTCVLGFQKDTSQWCAPLLKNREWVKQVAWPQKNS